MTVSKQRIDQVVAVQGSAQAAYDEAVADLNLARLNLARSEVRASVNGVVTNMELRPGTYVTPGKGVMALLDSDTLRVEGYFEETKLPRIHRGDAVNVRLLGSDHLLRGRVEGVAAGIEDRDRSSGATLLANVNPTFNWVRLAQRVPVRVALDPAERERTRRRRHRDRRSDRIGAGQRADGMRGNQNCTEYNIWIVPINMSDHMSS